MIKVKNKNLKNIIRIKNESNQNGRPCVKHLNNEKINKTSYKENITFFFLFSKIEVNEKASIK